MAIKGQITIDETFILEVDADPAVEGIDAPLSSIALLDSETGHGLWIKSGPNSTDWQNMGNQLSGIIDGGNPASYFDSLLCINGGGV